MSPGLTWILSVTFRPIEYVSNIFCLTSQHEYEDTIKITTDSGSFLLQVKASIPGLGVMVPKLLEFDYSPVKEVAEQVNNINFHSILMMNSNLK